MIRKVSLFFVCLCFVGCSAIFTNRDGPVVLDECSSLPAFADTIGVLGAGSVSLISSQSYLPWEPTEEERSVYIATGIGTALIFGITAAFGYYDYLKCVEEKQDQQEK